MDSIEEEMADEYEKMIKDALLPLKGKFESVIIIATKTLSDEGTIMFKQADGNVFAAACSCRLYYNNFMNDARKIEDA